MYFLFKLPKYFQKSSSRRSGGGLKNNSLSQFCPKITLYKADQLFFLNKKLAEKYIISNESVIRKIFSCFSSLIVLILIHFYSLDMCEHNAAIASSIGRLDLMQAWQLSALNVASLDQRKLEGYISSYYSQPNDPDESPNWSLHPFGSNMMQELLVIPSFSLVFIFKIKI